MLYPTARFFPAADAGLVVEFGDEISETVNGKVRSLDAAIAAAAIQGVVETVPSYRAVLVEYDPLCLTYDDLVERLGVLLETGVPQERNAPPVKEVPTVYGGEDGPDLSAVAATLGLSEEEVLRIHSQAVFTVYMLGFSPGFAYMGLVPESIAVPRLPTPRTSVPAGSVAMAGRQTGVYPQSTPGGWRLLGRTDIVLFDPQRDPPSFFQPDDRVRFVPVPALNARPAAQGSLEAQGNAQTSEVSSPSATPPAKPRSAPARPTIEVLSAGMLTTVQDLGRSGYQRLGVPVSGAMDGFAFRAANSLVGNSPDAAGLEVTVAGPVLRFRDDALIAVTGADLSAVLNTRDLGDWDIPLWTSVYVRRGSVLKFGPMGTRRTGCRSYVGIAGGISTVPVMNSRSTYLAGRFGGHAGRALQAGDLLPVFPPLTPDPLPARAARYLPASRRPAYGDAVTARLVLGPQADYFTDDAISALLQNEYLVSTTSDRMGLRLRGDRLAHRGPAEIISSGTALGTIQVPPDGQPIVLMADRQSAGGYPIIATLIRTDLPLLAQCLPGLGRVRFQAVTVDEAQAIHRATAGLWRSP